MGGGGGGEDVSDTAPSDLRKKLVTIVQSLRNFCVCRFRLPVCVLEKHFYFGILRR